MSGSECDTEGEDTEELQKEAADLENVAEDDIPPSPVSQAYITVPQYNIDKDGI